MRWVTQPDRLDQDHESRVIPNSHTHTPVSREKLMAVGYLTLKDPAHMPHIGAHEWARRQSGSRMRPIAKPRVRALRRACTCAGARRERRIRVYTYTHTRARDEKNQEGRGRLSLSLVSIFRGRAAAPATYSTAHRRRRRASTFCESCCGGPPQNVYNANWDCAPATREGRMGSRFFSGAKWVYLLIAGWEMDIFFKVFRERM